MRKNVKSLAPTLWFVIAAFIISIFAVWGGAGRLGEGRVKNTIATVGKENISADSYYQNLRSRLESLKRQFKEIDTKFIQQLNVPQQVLEQVIQQSIILQMAREIGIKASDEEVREKIKTYPVFRKDNKFIGFEEYKKILEWNHISISQFEESLKKEIIIDKAVNVLTSGIAITQEEVWDSYRKDKESARFEYILLETDKIDFKAEPSTYELEEYFRKNKDKYKIPEKREGLIVFFDTRELTNEIETDEEETKKYYRDNLSQFEEPEKLRISRIYLPFEDKEKELVFAEAKNILDKIHKGEDFGELAKRYSKDKKSEENGDWGLTEWKSLSSKEKDEISKLSEEQISDIIELEEGLSIIKITEKEPSRQKPLEEIKNRIITIIKDQKARNLSERKAAELEKKAKKEKSIELAAQIFGYKTSTTGLIKEGESIDDIDPSGSFSLSLFKLKEEEISSPIYTYNGVGIVQLQKIEPTRSARLEEVTDEVKEEFIAIRKKNRALEKIKRARIESENNGFEKTAEKYDLEYETAEEHKRGQYLSVIGESPEIDRLAFSLSLNKISDPVEFESGYALVRVLSRKEVTQEDFEKDKENERKNLLELKKNKFFQSYMMKMREEKGVKINYDLFLKINSEILSKFSEEK